MDKSKLDKFIEEIKEMPIKELLSLFKEAGGECKLEESYEMGYIQEGLFNL